MSARLWPKWYRPGQRKPLPEMMHKVAAFYGVTVDEIRKPDEAGNRRRDCTNARWVLAKAMRNRGTMSHSRIAQLLGLDHSSVIYACERFEVRARKNPEMLQILWNVA